MSLTKQQWDAVEAKLSYTGAIAHLMIDGYMLTIHRTRLTKMRDAFVAFVDGELRGEWLIEDCKIRRRFMRPSKRKLYRGKARKYLQSIVNRRNTRRDLKDWARAELDQSITVYMAHWNSFSALRRHLQENNDRIEHLSREPGPARLEVIEADPESDHNGG